MAKSRGRKKVKKVIRKTPVQKLPLMSNKHNGDIPEIYKVDIIKVMTVLESFNPSNNNWKSPLHCKVGQSFRILPDHPTWGFCCIIDFDIYETNLDTDFMLDVPANAVVRFTPKSKWVTAHELYGCYLHSIIEINKDMTKEALSKGINVDVTVKPAPFDNLLTHLNGAIQDSFDIEYDKDDL